MMTTSERGFWSLIATQFLGAFNDLSLKNLIIFLVIGMDLPAGQRELLVPLIGALFALPFILFSMAGGYLADRHSKRSVTIGVKIFEIGVMAFAIAALWMSNLTMELAAVFFMGVQSAVFGPSKYGLLPELLPEKRLSWGNGVLELGTFVASILGTAFGAMLSDLFRGRQAWSGVILSLLAGIGLITSLGISRLPAAAPEKTFQLNFISNFWRQLMALRADRALWLAMLGNTYFFFLAALLQFNIVFYGKEVLGLGDTQNGLLQASVALGIGIGSLAAGYLSGGKIEYGLIPLGAVGVSVFSLGLWMPGLTSTQFGLLLGLLGFFGGFAIVPISALLQHRPAREEKGGVLAAANLASFIGIFVASGVYWLFDARLGFDPRNIFLASAVMTALAMFYALYLLPDSFLRLIFWLLTHSLYRIRIVGRDHIPDKGGALFVSNHLSLIDAFLLLASTDRFIRFLMYKGMYERPWIKPFARILGAIPISSHVRPREIITALREAGDWIRRGEVACIFAEGQITRIGQLLPFKRGFERIMKDVDAPIIPVCVDGVWGSIFSLAHGRFSWKIPRRIPQPVAVYFGAPLSSHANHLEVRQAVQDLQAEAWEHRKPLMRMPHRSFVQTARRFPFRFAMVDGMVPKLSFGSALARTVFLARRLAHAWAGQEMVGIFLPPSVAGALVNFAALLLGKVPVNLNYTVSQETLASCARQCNLQTVITSKRFLEKIKMDAPSGTVLLEEMAANPGAVERVTALLMALLLPARLLEIALGRRKKGSLDDAATVIYSSGSTGDPKGVVLSHYNIASNVEQVGQVFALGPRDRILGILPFFHSFGFTGTLCLPAALGIGVVYHPTPLEPRAIGALVRQYAVTFLLATPTFLQIYLRGCEAEDFGSLQVVMAGAEKLPERLAAAFEERFGIRPVEGYGCTECSPVITVNTHDYRSAGFRQVGAKRGKIGHPLPGMSVRIVDPETGARLPVGQPGLLLVRGANVMSGYLNRPDKTAEVMRDGWYVTGDIATLDEDGFLQITDRLSRFSKIGGEMVPHIKVEEKLHEMAGATEQCFAVTGIPDEKKGERLVVLHTLTDERLKECLEKLPQAGLPNLWVPRPSLIFHVEQLPYLGTGKLDLRKLRDLASQLASPS
ncbi:MAG: MFS transporter [Acidobacteria bacterium]|nr:MFS transporter [Acidobacteriota bacterium]